jgi:hypothetical protein
MNISELRTRGATFGANALNERSSSLVQSSKRDASPGAGQLSRVAEVAPGAVDPLIQALVARLPKSNSVWSIDDRGKWLKAAAMIFNLIYKTDKD